MKKKHVLVVEDYRATALTFVIFLHKLGMTSDVATNGTNALEAARNNRYDLILIDVGLPDLDGIKVTQEIRKLDDKRKSQVPIIGHSCSIYFSDSELKKIGMQAFIIKPFDFPPFKKIFLKHTK